MDRGNRPRNEPQLAEHRSVRANRACAACRVRKQRCILSSTAGQTACDRCARHGMSCSFETEPTDAHQEQPGPTKLAQMVVELQKRVNHHEARIAELEQSDARPRKYPRLLQQANTNVSSPSAPAAFDGESQYAVQRWESSTSTPQNFDYSMNQIELGTPIATLRSLGALNERRAPGHGPIRSGMSVSSSPDPIASGILTEHEASCAFYIYFDHCHPWAPVLSHKFRAMGINLRRTSPTLFLTIVAIGARFWRQDDAQNGSTCPIGLHPQYPEIIKLLDVAVSRLLLRPCAADASLDTIQSLLLYLQWMPYDPCVARPAQLEGQSTFQTRYNEMSTWAVFGLALRYAGFCGLENRALNTFNDEVTAGIATDEDLDSMRVWLNMVTYDCNLTLTSGMSTSINPKPMNGRAYRFCSHHAAQNPGDVRYASMVELACIIQDVKCEKDNIAQRNQVLTVIAKANEDFDSWQRRWFCRLGETKLQQTQMPFTSVRWYRLALNSSLLRAVLSQSLPETLPLPPWAPEPLTVSLTAASQILLSVSTSSFQSVLSSKSRMSSTFSEGVLLLDPDARESLHHAVDSTWISYTFAITFLVLCYVRKIVDDDLQICAPPGSPAPLGRIAPSKPHPSSLLCRLARLALEIFGCTEQTSFFRPDNDYATLVQNATSLILLEPAETETTKIRADHISSIQAFFDIMDDTTWDWSMPLAGEQTDWNIES